jgi:excisionase family DNA binding protein
MSYSTKNSGRKSLRRQSVSSASVSASALLSIPEVCNELGVCQKTLWTLRHTRAIGWVMVRGQVRFTRAAVDKYIERMTVAA